MIRLNDKRHRVPCMAISDVLTWLDRRGCERFAKGDVLPYSRITSHVKAHPLASTHTWTILMGVGHEEGPDALLIVVSDHSDPNAPQVTDIFYQFDTVMDVVMQNSKLVNMPVTHLGELKRMGRPNNEPDPIGDLQRIHQENGAKSGPVTIESEAFTSSPQAQANQKSWEQLTPKNAAEDRVMVQGAPPYRLVATPCPHDDLEDGGDRFICVKCGAHFKDNPNDGSQGS